MFTAQTLLSQQDFLTRCSATHDWFVRPLPHCIDGMPGKAVPSYFHLVFNTSEGNKVAFKNMIHPFPHRLVAASILNKSTGGGGGGGGGGGERSKRAQRSLNIARFMCCRLSPRQPGSESP